MLGLLLVLFCSLPALGQANQAQKFTQREVSKPHRPSPGPMNMRDLFTEDYFTPVGATYDVQWPDTLDLASRGALAVHGLINFLDPEQNYEQYQIAFFNVNPPYMAHYNMEASNQGKIAKGVLTTRLMSGSRANLQQQAAMFNSMIDRVNEKGVFYNDLNQGPWVPSITTDDQLAVNTASVLESMIDLYQIKPHPKLLALIRLLADGIVSLAVIKGDLAYFTDVAPEQSDSHIGVLGYWQQMFYHGKSLRSLMRAYAITGDKKYLELGEKLKNLIMLKKHWQIEAAPKVIVPHEHAWFSGHHHSYTSALMGLLLYAEATNDPVLMEFVRSGYEYLRKYGIARIGLFGEMCTTADMVWLSVKLSELGVGDYWEDVDQYTRNMLVEQQLTDPERLRGVVSQMPALTDEVIYEPRFARGNMTSDRVIERNVGAWLSDCSNPTCVRPQTLRWTICCSGNAPPALYAAWQGILSYDGGVARVNLLLNRASEWVDVASSLPYEGKVVLCNKSAHTIEVRMPRWVDLKSVKCIVEGHDPAEVHPTRTVGRYLSFTELSAGDVLTLTFPVQERDEKYTLLWKLEDMWPESTDPGNAWKPPNPPNIYTMTFRGNTLVDIKPRVSGKVYQLFMRDELRSGTVRMKKSTQFVPSRLVHW
ncbi:MAG: hypothetical protein SGJ20_09985 [Planctomycetota bacterium]|nr:hypothetical protein [Planctomycetota bacterium]